MKAVYLGITILMLIACDSETKIESFENDIQLGVASMKVTGDSLALPYFDNGLLLLYSFEFDDAAEQFQKAQEIDSSFAMAYWGEAMTKNHALWREQEKDEANEILTSLGETRIEQRTMFKTDYEKDLFDAISILYGEGSKSECDKAYAEFMNALYKKYPDNNEIAAFYALSLLGSSEGKRDSTLYNKAATIAQSVIDENPNHPGALHYLIHGYDDPVNAHKALSAANSYAKVAPDATHALHMPSHIYIALGMWDEVINSNIASWEASKKQRQRKNLNYSKLGLHSFKWLMYGYLQKGDYAQARSLVEEMKKYCYLDPTSKSKAHHIMMKGAYFVETGLWDDELRIDTMSFDDLPIQIFASHKFVEGMYAYTQRDTNAINIIIGELERRIREVGNELLLGESQMCSGSYTRKRPMQVHVDRTEVMKKELQSLVAMISNDDTKVDKLLSEAISLEQKTTYLYGPPEIIKPSSELYGEWLLSKGRNEEAKLQFENTLVRAPKRLIPTKALEKISHETE